MTTSNLQVTLMEALRRVELRFAVCRFGRKVAPPVFLKDLHTPFTYTIGELILESLTFNEVQAAYVAFCGVWLTALVVSGHVPFHSPQAGHPAHLEGRAGVGGGEDEHAPLRHDADRRHHQRDGASARPPARPPAGPPARPSCESACLPMRVYVPAQVLSEYEQDINGERVSLCCPTAALTGPRQRA
jgi:hypothetical protein